MKKSPEQVLAELTGDRTETEAATHFEIETRPCACESETDHIKGEQP